MSNEFHVRHATLDDVARLAGLINAAFVVERFELMPFYRAQGYVETGTKPFPYPDATKECHLIVMSKPLRNDR